MNPPKMPIHIGDFLRDTGHLRALLIGAYMLLLFHHWSTGALPDDDEQLAAITRMTKGEWNRARPILVKFFEPGWRHGRVEEDLESAKQSYEARAKAGKKGGEAKATPKQNPSIATAGPEQPLTLDHLPKKACSAGAEARDENFEAFWAAYPRRNGDNPKAPSAKLFSAAVKAGTDPQEIIDAARKFAAAESKNVGTQFIPQAVKWLRNKRWLDFAPNGAGGNLAASFDIRSHLV